MRALISLTLALTWASLAHAQDVARSLETRWVRDSVEYYTLTRMVYELAGDAVVAQAKGLKKGERWAVVLDVDETVLDNSTYQLEQAAYNRTFDWASWNAWTERRVATEVPGAVAFIDAVRGAGGQVVFLTNRHVSTGPATVDNLKRVGAWREGDLLCLLTDDEAYTKRVRRTELRDGKGACAFPDGGRRVLAYLGDTLHDFPETGEDGSRETDFGARFFILPNPMYGSWSGKITRPDLLSAPAPAAH